MSPPIRILVADDHQLVLDGLAAALSSPPDLDVVATAVSWSSLQLVDATGIDVVVCDLDLSDGKGTDAVQLFDEIPVVLITGQGDRTGVRAALAAGCAGFVSKGAPIEELRSAVRLVAAGGSAFSADALRGAATTPDPTPADDSALTDRERVVLQLLADGSNAQAIATELHLSLHTVRNHIRAIREKLGAASQLEAVVSAVRAGIVEFRRPNGTNGQP